MPRAASLEKNGNLAKDEHGTLQSLSSPILSKIDNGFVCFKDAVTGKAEGKYTAFHTLDGMALLVSVCNERQRSPLMLCGFDRC